MNRADRRATAKGRAKGIQPVPLAEPTQVAPEGQLFAVKVAVGMESVTADGTRVKVYVLHLYTPNGVQLVEPTPDGDVPVAVVTAPIKVGKAVLAPSSGLLVPH
jgi:hypothetical protein